MRSGRIDWMILLLLGGIFTTIGVVVGLLVGKPILDNARATEQWPQTEGEILESELRETSSDNGSTLYSAHVVYHYALDGGEFESNRVWYGDSYSTSDRSEMFEIVKRFPVGETVTVYYSPDKPSESVLIPGAYVLSHVLYVIGLAFLGVGCLLLLILVYSVARSKMGLTPGETTFDQSMSDEAERQFGGDGR